MEYLKRVNKIPTPFVIILVWLFFSFPFFLGKTPFPSDYQVNFFQPWVQYPLEKGPVKNNAQPDIIGQIYPWRHFSISELKQGRIPFWNPYSFSGTPHLANYQSAVFSIYNLIFFLPIKFITAWGFLVVLQPLLAGLFTYFYTRSVGISKKGSVQSSIAFMFCGFLVTWMGYSTLGFAILPLPLALFLVEKFFKSRKLIFAALLSFTIPLSFFSGHFQTSLYFLLAVVFYIIFLALFKKKQYIYSLWFILCGLMLCAIQILPSIEFYSLSVRSALFQKFEAIPWMYLPSLIAPDYYGNPVTRNDWFGHYAEWNGYAGAVGLLLACFAISLWRNKHVLFFLILSLLACLLAFDTPLLSLLVSLKVPVLSTSAASRIIVLFSFAIAVLSGFGFDRVFEISKKGKKTFIITTVILLVIGVTMLTVPFVGLLKAEKIQIALKNSILPIGILATSTILFLTPQVLKKKRIVFIASLLLLLLSSVEMLRFSTKWQSFNKTSQVYQDVDIVDYYNSQNHFDRFLGLSGGEDAVYYQIPIPSGYDPLYIGDYGRLVKFLEKGEFTAPDRSVVNFPLSGKYTPKAIDFLGIKTIVHKESDGNFPWAFPFEKYPSEQFEKIYDDEAYNVFKNRTSFNKAFLVGEIRTAPNDKMLSLMFESDLKRIAFNDKVTFTGNGQGKVAVTDYKPNKIELSIESSGKNFLVVTDNFYPGWKAKVNGMEKPVLKINYTFRGLEIPNGKSKVIMTMMPESFVIGTYFFALGLMGIIIVGVLKRIKNE